MPRDLSKIRNIGIIAHIDAGKTTLTEGMLFYSGTIHRFGEVDKGTTETDFDEEEQQRGITIYAACVTFQWRDVIVNLIDTPGHVDFTAEVERSLRVLDGGVVVFSAREGVEAQSETVWRQADKYKVPRIAFINKMDREGADFPGTFQEIRDRLGHNPVAIQIPYGSGPPHVQNPFRGVIDLVEMRLLQFSREGNKPSQIAVSPIPDDARDEAQRWRHDLLEHLYGFSDELMEKTLADQPIEPALLRQVLRSATIQGLAVPVLCGSALHHAGVQPVLDAVADYLPGPAEVPSVEGVDFSQKKKGSKIVRKSSPDEPFCGLVFKVVAEKHGETHYVRVYSGKLKGNSRVYNPRVDRKENVTQLWHLQASRRTQVESVEAGDIIGIIGLRHSITGDTLCDPHEPVLLDGIQFPQTVISMAIEPETTAERKKLADRLESLKRQDPTFRAVENEETGQTIISGMGELHLEIIKNRLLRDFNLNVKVHKPRVSYRETVEHKAEVVGECRRQQAGQMLFARVKLRVEPQAAGETVSLEPAAAQQIPEPFLSILLQDLQDRAAGGGTFGYPLMNLRVTVLGGEISQTETSEPAIHIAAADAFDKALRAAGVVILEPIMKVEITTPDEFLGDLVGDLQQRRATITRTETRGKGTVIDARAPLANLFGYTSAMRSLSQGRASATMEPSHYGPAPPEVLESFL
ncbi:MAG: elongation factor G [Planctomycetia bacterium]|nr:elongation factor G [Planctomycetia bacterium]